MTVFHGSNIGFDKVSLDFAKDKRDFGRGFYTTTIKEQAADWAEALCARSKTDTAYLYTFEFSMANLETACILQAKPPAFNSFGKGIVQSCV